MVYRDAVEAVTNCDRVVIRNGAEVELSLIPETAPSNDIVAGAGPVLFARSVVRSLVCNPNFMRFTYALQLLDIARLGREAGIVGISKRAGKPISIRFDSADSAERFVADVA